MEQGVLYCSSLGQLLVFYPTISIQLLDYLLYDQVQIKPDENMTTRISDMKFCVIEDDEPLLISRNVTKQEVTLQ